MRHTNDFSAPDIRPQLKEIVANSGLTIRQLSAACGINKSRLSSLLNSKAPLTVTDLQVLGVALRFNPRDLIPQIDGFEVGSDITPDGVFNEKAAEIATQLLIMAENKYEVQGAELTIDTMLRWYMRNGGRLAETDQIEKYIGVFTAPKPLDNILIPERVGPNALVARSLNTKDPERVSQYISNLDTPSREEIVFSYAQTEKRNRWQIFDRSVCVDFPGAGPRFSLEYASLLMPVVAANNERLIINYSVLLSTKLLDPPV